MCSGGGKLLYINMMKIGLFSFSFHLEEAGCTARLTVQIPTHHGGKLDTNPSEPKHRDQ